MPPHTLPFPTSSDPRRTSPARAFAVLAARLLDGWRALQRSERDEFLSQAANHAELEQRLRQWDDYCVTRARQRSHW